MAVARIAGVNIPAQKHICIGLQSIYGIGPTRAKKICLESKVDPTAKASTLTEADLDLLRNEVAKFTVEGDLRREVYVRKIK